MSCVIFAFLNFHYLNTSRLMFLSLLRSIFALDPLKLNWRLGLGCRLVEEMLSELLRVAGFGERLTDSGMTELLPWRILSRRLFLLDFWTSRVWLCSFWGSTCYLTGDSIKAIFFLVFLITNLIFSLYASYVGILVTFSFGVMLEMALPRPLLFLPGKLILVWIREFISGIRVSEVAEASWVDWELCRCLI